MFENRPRILYPGCRVPIFKVAESKLNILSSFLLYLGLFFVMIFLALENILPTNYLGGIVIALFIGGLCYAWLNAWRQTNKLLAVEGREPLKKSTREESAPEKSRDTKSNEKVLVPAA